MPIYELECSLGHRIEVIQAISMAIPSCPSCGSEMNKLPSSFSIGKRAVLPPSPEAMPQTWKGTYDGNREYVNSLRKLVDERVKIEERYPELAGDRRPILAHEGRYESAPLRAGDPVIAGSAHDHSIGHEHGHGHGHGHDHGHGHVHGGSETVPSVKSGPGQKAPD